jgi:ketosteroid isomerase-like protein
MNDIPVTPTELFYALHECVKMYDADGQAEIFAENGIWEFPFAVDNNIPKKIEGRENIRLFGRKGMDRSKKAGRRICNYNSVAVHHTLDSNTIIVEFELEGEILADHSKYKVPYIQLIKVENGKIVLLRDYFPIEILKNVIENKAAG